MARAKSELRPRGIEEFANVRNAARLASGGNSEENLTTLCSTCHAWAHGKTECPNLQSNSQPRPVTKTIEVELSVNSL